MTASPSPPAPPARWRELASPVLAPRAALVLLGIWLNAADSLVTATIMPSVARDLGGYAWFGWAVAGYLLGSIMAGASSGQLAQRLGLRTALILAALAYATGCAVSAGAPSIQIFLIGRLVQGIGAGWIVGFCYVAIGVVFPERLWARMFGAGAGVWGVASFLGPLVGGAFAAAGIWRWAFWMFAGQGLLFVVAVIALLKAGQGSDDEATRPLAWRTLSLLAVAIFAIAGADIATGRIWPSILLVLGLAFLALAGRVNAAPGERLLPREAAHPATLAGSGYAMIFAFSVASAVFGVYGAAILQTLQRLSPLQAGYVVSMDAVGWTATALIVSGQPDRRHGTLIRGGALTITAGLICLAVFIGTPWIWGVVAGAAILGAGFGLAWALITRRILGALPADELALGAAATPTTQLIGGAVGAAAAGAIANLLGLAHAFTPQRAAFAAPWLFAAFLPVAALGCLAAARLGQGVREG